jgi:hypothetical protein
MKEYIKIEIRAFVRNELKHLDKRISLIFSKNEQAMTLSKINLDKRLDDMNEVRAQLDRQVKTFVSSERFEGELKAVNKKVDYVAKIIYVGMGIWIVLQIIIVWVLSLIFKT